MGALFCGVVIRILELVVSQDFLGFVLHRQQIFFDNQFQSPVNQVTEYQSKAEVHWDQNDITLFFVSRKKIYVFDWEKYWLPRQQRGIGEVHQWAYERSNAGPNAKENQIWPVQVFHES